MVELAAAALPPASVDGMRQALQRIRQWIAEPAFRQGDAQAAVHFVEVHAVSVIQAKVDFLRHLFAVPDLAARHQREVVGAIEALAKKAPSEAVAEAARHLAALLRLDERMRVSDAIVTSRGQPSSLGEAFSEAWLEAIEHGAHADNLILVTLLGLDGHSGPVEPAILQALSEAAERHARLALEAMRRAAEARSPVVAAEDLFAARTLEDLLRLPPSEQPTLSIEEMDALVGGPDES